MEAKYNVFAKVEWKLDHEVEEFPHLQVNI